MLAGAGRDDGSAGRLPRENSPGHGAGVVPGVAQREGYTLRAGAAVAQHQERLIRRKFLDARLQLRHRKQHGLGCMRTIPFVLFPNVDHAHSGLHKRDRVGSADLERKLVGRGDVGHPGYLTAPVVTDEDEADEGFFFGVAVIFSFSRICEYTGAAMKIVE